MTLYTGRRQEVGIGKEGTRGDGDDNDYWMPKTAVTFDDKVRKSLVAGSYGNITDAAMTGYVTGKWAEGDIEGEINVNSFGLILLALCGAESAGGDIGGGVYDHTYTLANTNTHQSLVLRIVDPVESVWFRRVMINSLSIDITLGEIVKYTANFMSRVHQTLATESPTYAIDHRFIARDLVLQLAPAFDSDWTDFTTYPQISVKNLTLEFAKNIGTLDVVNTLEPEDIVNKGFKVTGSLELNYEDKTWRNYMLNNTTRAMKIVLASRKGIGTASFPTWTMIFPKVHFDTWEPVNALDDITSQTINFDIYYDLANTRLWSSFVLRNTVASDY